MNSPADQEMRAQLAAIVESSIDAIISKSLDGRITSWNRGAQKMFGYSAEETIGKSMLMLFPPERVQEEAELIAQLVRGERIDHFETVRVRKDGKRIDVSVTISPIRNNEGQITGASKIARDITEHKRLQEELNVTHEKLRDLLAHSPAVLYILKIGGQTVTPVVVSDNMERLLGFTVEEASHHDWWANHLHPEDRERVLASGGPISLEAGQSIEYRIRHKDGTYRWVEDTNRVVLDSDRQKMAVGVWTDITERKKLEEQFRHTQKMEIIGRLASGVAHDFNNILTIIQMHSEILKGDNLSTGQLESAEAISASVHRAAALTRQLLLFSRREVFQPQHLDLNDSVATTTKMLKRVLGEDIQLQLKLPMQPMFVHADTGMMDQVLMNLVINARDAMPNGGQLSIETSGVEFDEFAASQSVQVRPGSFVRLSVSDTGSGIPREILPKIFEPFFTTKGVGKGTGLGLATVFGIVQQHQGWVDVHSEMGQGTTFRIYLPRLVTSGSQKSSQPAFAAVSGGNETILLAEDDLSLRDSVRKALSQLGYRILEAHGGVKALELGKQNQAEIRLLLTSLMLSDGMTGKALAQLLLQENPNLKVIYMSGYSAAVVGMDFPLNEGVNFLIKPFQAAKLVRTIRDSLDEIDISNSGQGT